MRIKCRRKLSHAPHTATYLWRDGREKENSLKDTQCTRRKGKNNADNVASKTALRMNGDRSKHVILFDSSPVL